MRIKLTTRIHERLAERFVCIQYPKPSAYFPRYTLWARFVDLHRDQQGWVVFVAFWATVGFLSFIGNLFF
jgi:hypothetical protein